MIGNDDLWDFGASGGRDKLLVGSGLLQTTACGLLVDVWAGRGSLWLVHRIPLLTRVAVEILQRMWNISCMHVCAPVVYIYVRMGILGIITSKTMDCIIMS